MCCRLRSRNSFAIPTESSCAALNAFSSAIITLLLDQTVGNVLQRHALPPAPKRKRTTTWPVFIRTHLALLAGTDFFTAEVLTLRGLVDLLRGVFHPP
jgi:hypothetical protein